MDEKLNQQYLESLMDLFHRDGWKSLMEEMQITLNQVSTIDWIKTSEQLNYARGKREVLLTLLKLEATVREALEAADAEGV